MTDARAAKNPPMLWIVAAFAAVYLVWGSTYLAIRFGVETIPPFIMAGTRFLIVSIPLYAWCRWRGAEKPTLTHWRSAAIIGGLLLLCGNGCVSWAEKYVPSGPAALMVTTLPIWLVLLDWLRRDGVRPGWAEIVGLLMGFAGVAVLVGSDKLAGEPIDRAGAIVLMLGSLSWAIGSIYSRGAPLPKSKWLAISMEMLCGGVMLWLLAGIRGDWSRFDLSLVSRKSVLAVVYLSLLGSLIGYSAYIWLLSVTTPARVSTYAFVNPVVAVLVGYWWGDEALTTRVLVAAIVIVSGVVLITLYGRRAGATPVTGAAKQSTHGLEAISPAGAAIQQLSHWEDASGGRGFSMQQLLDEHEGLNRPYYEFLRRETMSMGLYQIPAGCVDRQRPHVEDEVYFVLAGRGRFRVGDQLHEAAPGSVLYVPAGVEHRFEEIVESLRLLVFFSPPETEPGNVENNDGRNARASKLCGTR